jgi:ACS family pantothenate transporter-like MFS transporter
MTALELLSCIYPDIVPPLLLRLIHIHSFTVTHWYFFVAQWYLLDQNSMTAGQPFSLDLKAKSKIYSITQINTLPTIATAISIVCALAAGLFADRTGKFWIPAVLVTIPVLLGNILLAVWNVREKGRGAAFVIIGAEGGEF